MKYDILTLVVNAVCVLHVRYANCNDGLYRLNRQQKVKQVVVHFVVRSLSWAVFE